jgi:hypothetical protein
VERDVVDTANPRDPATVGVIPRLVAARSGSLASASVGPRDFAGLAHLRDRIGSRLAAGIVLYTGERTLPYGDGLWAVPLQALWRSTTTVP